MGCDIHLYKEKKINGVWVTADEGWHDEFGDGYIDAPLENRFSDRNYWLFGFLAGVRRDVSWGFAPRGLPQDYSTEVGVVSDSWGGDGHSHSFLYLHELKDSLALLDKKTITIAGMKDNDSLKKFMESYNSDKKTDWSLLWPYCGWTSNKDSSRFEVEAPALLYLDAVEKIINSFDGVDGENQRIVFWFDN